jgi:hypothetical protein
MIAADFGVVRGRPDAQIHALLVVRSIEKVPSSEYPKFLPSLAGKIKSRKG